MSVDEALLDFIGRLRGAGLSVSVSESMDSLRALEAAPLTDRGFLKAVLSTTLVKNESDIPVFDHVFDEFFSGAAASALTDGEHGEEPWETPPDLSEIEEMLARALVEGPDDLLEALGRAAAAGIGEMEGGFGPGSRTALPMAGTGYYMFRAMSRLEFREMVLELEQMLADGRIDTGMPPVMATEELRRRADVFRDALERELARRVPRDRGRPVPSRRRLPVRPEEVDFTTASLNQVQEMRRILPALARRLAARLARKVSAGRAGRVDIRNTLRHSVSTGGVPLDVKYRRRVPSRPELFILCDISGSVRTFSTFTLQLVYSLHQQFSSVRSFAFIDRTDEVTHCFSEFDVKEAVERAYREADVVDGDGHSDVGRAIEHFLHEYGSDLTAKSTVLVLSDARNNGMPPRMEALEEIGERARRVYWLNPEPVEKWGAGDSIIELYTPLCHSVHECRNLRQLADFVYKGT